MLFGFLSEDHKQAFQQAARRTQRGGPEAPNCGARTRNGGLCRNTPTFSGKRCLRHAGPHHATLYREKQLRDFAVGKLSFAKWRKAEAKRAVNRLRERWKKSPWHPGSTINLGEHELLFQEEMRAHGVVLDQMPPATADWLRWKYRRHQLDRDNDVAWKEVLHHEFKDRLEKAGPCPLNTSGSLVAEMVDVVGPVWAAEKPNHFSKRNSPDLLHPSPANKGRDSAIAVFEAEEPAMPDPDDEQAMQRLAQVNYENCGTLNSLYAKCPHEADKMKVLLALRDAIDQPDNKTAQQRWFQIVAALHR